MLPKQHMTRPTRLCLLILASAFVLISARAQQPVSADAQDGTAPKEINVKARKNPGNLRYRFFLDGQKRLQGFLPPEPRMLDMMFRISFTELTAPEQDDYVPHTWAVSVVGESVDRVVPVRRGGYFLLPDDPIAYREGASIMIKDQSRPRAVELGWVIRVGQEQRLTYADLGEAMAEMRGVQKAIPIYMVSAITEKFAKYDGLKACFLGARGTILINGEPAADATAVGNCVVLRFDPKTDSGAVIEFVGPLDIVTVVETSLYLQKGS